MSPNQPGAIYDLLVIGGGINGAGIARDAAGRGLRVALCEQDDLAAHTSSASTKLIHGGLRYLEHYEFGLVRKALRERETLLRSAPHIMWPMRFVMPHDPSQRPAWLIRSGLFLYDHLARRDMLPASNAVQLSQHAAGHGLQSRYSRAFVYSDGWVDDARLVVLNALAAAERGARILPRTRFVSAEPQGRHWRLILEDRRQNRQYTIQARAIVNASGPWATRLSGLPRPAHYDLRLVKGSHIVVRRRFAHDYAYLFQQPDQRVVFAIPYEKHYTLIGTTDVDFHGEPHDAAVDDAEIDYLCSAVNRYLQSPVSAREVIWRFAGVRPLLADASDRAAQVTRDYHLGWQADSPPLLHIFGGKLTTFRQLAEDAIDQLGQRLPIPGERWTRRASLPGGEHLLAEGPHVRNVLHFDQWVDALQRQYPWLPTAVRQRYARAYGSRLHVLLKDCRSLDDLGEPILPGLYAREVAYLQSHEWAQTAADILWRRSKLGLHLPTQATQTLQSWLERHPSPLDSPVTPAGDTP